MNYLRSLPILILILTLLELTPTNAQNEFPQEKASSRTPVQMRQSSIMLVPHFTGGVLMGEISEMLGDRTQDKLVYGVGASLEWHVKPSLAVGACFDAIWKNSPVAWRSSIRSFSFSYALLWRADPFKRSSFYLRPEVGFVNGRWPRGWGGDAIDFEARAYIRLGVGLFSYTAGATNTRFEIYYRHVFLGDEIGGYRVDFDVEQIGVEFGVGISLKK